MAARNSPHPPGTVPPWPSPNAASALLTPSSFGEDRNGCACSRAEIGGRWNDESLRLVAQLARSRALRAPAPLRGAAAQGWYRRRWGLISSLSPWSARTSFRTLNRARRQPDGLLACPQAWGKKERERDRERERESEGGREGGYTNRAAVGQIQAYHSQLPKVGEYFCDHSRLPFILPDPPPTPPPTREAGAMSSALEPHGRAVGVVFWPEPPFGNSSKSHHQKMSGWTGWTDNK